MTTVAFRVRIEGLVQGVGFRPFVHALAIRQGLAGSIANDGAGVIVEIEGDDDGARRFIQALETEVPPLAIIERIVTTEQPARGMHGFTIAESQNAGGRSTLVSPDVATCADCLRELFDARDRRFRYPFINCTNCGPRFTIVRDVPYDRGATTMASFTMCAACAREYADPADRRFHAQPVACPACGPRLTLVDASGRAHTGDAIAETARLIRAGAIVAVKGLGGFHLAADARNEAAVAALRARKHREEKPFAIMACDIVGARRLTCVSREEERLLSSPRRPIVLLERRPDAGLAAAVAPGNRFVGIMLPYTPIHHLLARALDGPIVLTSGNRSDEPIVYRDAEAPDRLRGIADAYLTHDRAIHVRTDDSVVRVFRGAAMPIRRSRGFAPQPITLPWAVERPVLACGAELKSTICVARQRHAFLSHHIGDLESYEALRSFTEAVAHFQRLFDVTPAVIAHDLHPEYLSTKWAIADAGMPRLPVQHHHAHVAACLGDNGTRERVIGVAFDGLGYGADGTLWGGEFLLADLTGYERVGHLAPVPMPGGVAAIREPWRMAAVYLERAFGGETPRVPVVERQAARWPAVLAVARAGLHSPATSSVGRLFDAASALLDVRDAVSYEGQAAAELEQLADPAELGAYTARLVDGPVSFTLSGAELIRALVDDRRAGVARSVIAARFHNGVAEAILRGCRWARERSGLATAALTGGVFQNTLLLERATTLLENDDFRVLRHRQVPCNDGGISFGQALIAGHASAGRPDASGGLRGDDAQRTLGPTVQPGGST